MRHVDDTTLGLLAAVFGTEPDAHAVSILSDRLEEIGRLDLKWILFGRCPLCGGEMRERKLRRGETWSDLDEPYLRCLTCHEEDVDANKAKGVNSARVNRIVRLLGLKRCDSGKHRRSTERGMLAAWFSADDCKKCGGLGLLRPGAR